jgi:hypothetical protein
VNPTPSPEIDSLIQQQAETAMPGSQQIAEQLFRGVAYDKGGSQDFRIELEQGKCYGFVGAADPGVERLEIFLWDPGDSRIDSNKSKTREAFVQYCADKTGTYRFQAKVGRGAGHFAVGVFGKDAPEKAPEPTVAKMDLEKIIEDEAGSVAPGATRLGNFYKATTEKADFYVQLDKNTCYWFIGAATEAVDDYYIYLWDQKKTRIGETKADTNRAHFGHCAESSAMYHLQVKVDDADDEVKLGVYAKAKGK